MGALLSGIWQGRLLSNSSARVLREIMERCATGAMRLKGRLPAGTTVAHKTGTAGGTVNDVGVIALPGDRGQIVVVVMSKSGAAPMQERESAVADISRAIYDFFLFSS